MKPVFDKIAFVDRLRHAGVEERVALEHADGLEQAFFEAFGARSTSKDFERFRFNKAAYTEGLRNVGLDESIARAYADALELAFIGAISTRSAPIGHKSGH